MGLLETTVVGRVRERREASARSLRTLEGGKTFLGFIRFYVAGILKTGRRDQSNSLRDAASVGQEAKPISRMRCYLDSLIVQLSMLVRTGHTSYFKNVYNINKKKGGNRTLKMDFIFLDRHNDNAVSHERHRKLCVNTHGIVKVIKYLKNVLKK